jgi:hypothetical protein
LRRHVDKLVLLGLLTLLVGAVHGYARFGKATAKPASHAAKAVNQTGRSAPLTLDRATKFDRLFSEPDFALP